MLCASETELPGLSICYYRFGEFGSRWAMWVTALRQWGSPDALMLLASPLLERRNLSMCLTNCFNLTTWAAVDCDWCVSTLSRYWCLSGAQLVVGGPYPGDSTQVVRMSCMHNAAGIPHYANADTLLCDHTLNYLPLLLLPFLPRSMLVPCCVQGDASHWW